MIHADDHESAVRAVQRPHADECCRCEGIQSGMCCVLEARVVQIASITTVAGRPHQRREQMDGADAAARE